MEARDYLPHYTYDDYVNWEGRWELILGVPHAMSPMPVPKHQRIAAKLVTALTNALEGYDTCQVYHPIDYKIKDDIVVQPDALVVFGDIKKAFLDFPPALVAEILSPSTASKDRLFKFNIYQQQGIPYYLIIDPVTEAVEIYVVQGDSYQLGQHGRTVRQVFTFSENCSADIDFQKIWN